MTAQLQTPRWPFIFPDLSEDTQLVKCDQTQLPPQVDDTPLQIFLSSHLFIVKGIGKGFKDLDTLFSKPTLLYCRIQKMFSLTENLWIYRVLLSIISEFSLTNLYSEFSLFTFTLNIILLCSYLESIFLVLQYIKLNLCENKAFFSQLNTLFLKNK